VRALLLAGQGSAVRSRFIRTEELLLSLLKPGVGFFYQPVTIKLLRTLLKILSGVCQ